MLGLFLSAYQHAAKPIEPMMTAFDDPAPCALAGFVYDLPGFLAVTANVLVKPTSRMVVRTSSSSAPLSRPMPCGRSSVGAGRSTTMLAIVARTSFMSWRLAPAIAATMGTPCPSVSTDRLTPAFPQSVGLGPVVFPPSGALVIAPSMLSQSQSMPFDSSMSIQVFRIGSMEICFQLASTH